MTCTKVVLKNFAKLTGKRLALSHRNFFRKLKFFIIFAENVLFSLFRRLLEKNEKIDGILSALSTTNEDTEQVMAELEELITPTEKQQLEKLKIDLAR